MNNRPEPVMDAPAEVARLRRELNEARAELSKGAELMAELLAAHKRRDALLRIFVNIGYGNRTPHSTECGCDLCEALAAAKRELAS